MCGGLIRSLPMTAHRFDAVISVSRIFIIRRSRKLRETHHLLHYFDLTEDVAVTGCVKGSAKALITRFSPVRVGSRFYQHRHE